MLDKFMEFGFKLGSQRHMTAIRDGFALTMPLIMAGAFAIMFNNVFFNGSSLLATYLPGGAENGYIMFTSKYISPWLSAFDAGTLSLTGLALVATLAYTRAVSEKVDPITTLVVALGSFFVLQPAVRVSEVAPWIANYFGAMGIFVALVTGLVASEIYMYFTKKGWTIKMPEMVPPSVGRGFAGIIPGAITLGVFALVPYIFSILLMNGVLAEGSSQNIFAVVESGIQGTFMKWFGSTDPSSYFSGVFGVFMVTISQTVLWFFGLHGANMLQPVIVPIWGTFETLNVQAFANEGAKAILYPWTSGSWVIYVNHGGSGATLGLLIAIKMFSRKKDEHEIVAIGGPSGVFQINEPIIFGIPLVLNPLYAIPFIFSTPIISAVAYTSVFIGFGKAPVNSLPWTTPPIISAFLATNGDIPSVILAIAMIALSVVIYAPFVIYGTRKFVRENNI